MKLGSYSYSCLFYLEECAGIKIYVRIVSRLFGNGELGFRS